MTRLRGASPAKATGWTSAQPAVTAASASSGVQDDVQAAVPGVEMANLPVAEEHIPRCGGELVAEPDRPLGGVGHLAGPLFHLGQGEHPLREHGLHISRRVLVLLDVRRPRRRPRAWPRAGRLRWAGHLPTLEPPQELSGILTAFLREIVPAG
jgi:hypothetical protein